MANKMKLIKSVKWETNDGKKSWFKGTNFDYGLVINENEHILTIEDLTQLKKMCDFMLKNLGNSYKDGKKTREIDILSINEQNDIVSMGVIINAKRK